MADKKGTDTWFILVALVIVLLMPVAVYLALQDGAKHDSTINAVADRRQAAQDLHQIHVACERFRMERYQDVDADSRGEYAALGAVADAELLADRFTVVDSETVEAGLYRFRALVPTATDEAELSQVIVAVPGGDGLGVLVIDSEGILRAPPLDWTPSPDHAVDPRTWPEWSAQDS